MRIAFICFIVGSLFSLATYAKLTDVAITSGLPLIVGRQNVEITATYNGTYTNESTIVVVCGSSLVAMVFIRASGNSIINLDFDSNPGIGLASGSDVTIVSSVYEEKTVVLKINQMVAADEGTSCVFDQGSGDEVSLTIAFAAETTTSALTTSALTTSALTTSALTTSALTTSALTTSALRTSALMTAITTTPSTTTTPTSCSSVNTSTYYIWSSVGTGCSKTSYNLHGCKTILLCTVSGDAMISDCGNDNKWEPEVPTCSGNKKRASLNIIFIILMMMLNFA